MNQSKPKLLLSVLVVFVSKITASYYRYTFSKEVVGRWVVSCSGLPEVLQGLKD